MSDLVSIITANYNSERFIAETIESVLRQTYTDWEMIVVDDCSTDNGVTIVSEYVRKDPRIRLIRLEHNSGAALTRNRAIEEAKGRFIAFLDSDDQWDPEKLERQIGFMQEKGAELSYCSYRTIDEEGEPLALVVNPPESLDYKEMLKENQIGCLGAVYDTKQIGKCYMPDIRKRQDYGLWLSILKKIPRAYKVPGVLATYRIRKLSVSSNKLGLLKYNYELFKNVEGFSAPRAIYYVMWNIYRKLKKRA